MTNIKKFNNKRMMLTFAAVFLLPVLLAKLALENGWFNQAATNKGQLISPPLDATSLDIRQSEPKWKLVYVLPEICEQACENALYSIIQVHSALGKHSDRAEAVVITHEKSDTVQLGILEQNLKVRLLSSDLQTVNQVFKDTSVEGIFISDTLDNVILRYSLQNDSKKSVLDSRDILSDMRKVLKLSRIG
ncbi:MAG: hypothetical protein ACI9LX_000227 [Paraglaciecola sp.]